jgi:hypothetical protein
MIINKYKIDLIILFIIGCIVCFYLNRFLKNMITEPLNPLVFPNRKNNKYANPSGHAQMNSFCVGFLLLLYFYDKKDKQNIFLNCLCLSLFFYLSSFITCIIHRYHTYGQLLFGTIIGILFSGFCFFIYRFS